MLVSECFIEPSEFVMWYAPNKTPLFVERFMTTPQRWNESEFFHNLCSSTRRFELTVCNGSRVRCFMVCLNKHQNMGACRCVNLTSSLSFGFPTWLTWLLSTWWTCALRRSWFWSNMIVRGVDCIALPNKACSDCYGWRGGWYCGWLPNPAPPWKSETYIPSGYLT